MKDIKGMVSVIIPTYNRAKQCKAAVESVLSQSYKNVQIIVVDDGSTDNTKELICSLDSSIKMISQRNGGVSAARNAGMESATGEYIAFLDSDDIWLPWKLESQVRVLQDTPEAVMIWTDMAAVNENGNIVHESYLKLMYSAYKYFDRDKHFAKIRILSDIWPECPDIYSNRKVYNGNIFSWMFLGNLVHTSTVLIRHSCQKKVGLFDLGLLKSGEDYDFHFRTCRVGEAAYLDIPSTYYQIGAEDQLTEWKYKSWIARNNIITLEKMLAVAKNEICLPQHMINKHLADSYAWAGLTQFDAGNRTVARANLAKSLRFSPAQVRIITFLLLTFLPSKISEGLRGARRNVLKKVTPR